MTNKVRYRFVLVLPVLCIIVGFFAPEYQLDLLATACIYGLFAASVDFSYGYAGILNLGSALYFGIGSYTMAYGLKHGFDSLLLFIAGMVLSVIIASVIGYVGFRVKASQVHFGLIGLALTLGVQQLAISLYHFTGGSNGITNVPLMSFHLFGLDVSFQSHTSYYFFVILTVFVLFLALWTLVHSQFGKVTKALRHDESKLETMGYNPMRVKMTVHLITACISSIAGALFVPVSGIAYPDLFGVAFSMSVLIWVALGGTGTLIGPMLAAIVLKLGESTLSSSFQETYMLVIGLVFVVMVIMAPGGSAGLLHRMIKKG
ncbi:branched-chain amino acid ABC transporter permease [Paenibacillus beijingensis]|uniref:Branched-chain amino acid ABC transporter permease n=1 Tax=Paenibacillus beijingensis TaxID=1126833 RepID=A0A0D5NL35_9BACL|nr:branched-chain amino acid ABC transporter permease [Paenibacillus beijingensis]AJY75618.1 hypothetical protein VN24_14950 [Paenibacillus beijingensis]